MIKKFNNSGTFENATNIKTFLKSQFVFLLGNKITPTKNKYIALISHIATAVITTVFKEGPCIEPKLKFLLIDIKKELLGMILIIEPSIIITKPK